jgi:hypothetical protein
LFEDDAVVVGASILSLYEFELRLHHLGVDVATRAAEVSRYRALLNEVVDVDEAVRSDPLAIQRDRARRRDGCFDCGHGFGEERNACSPRPAFCRHPLEFAESGSLASEVRCARIVEVPRRRVSAPARLSWLDSRSMLRA